MAVANYHYFYAIGEKIKAVTRKRRQYSQFQNSSQKRHLEKQRMR